MKKNGKKSGKYKRIIKKCIICGKRFWVYESDIKRRKAIFCSKKCKGEWMSNHQLGKNNPCYKGKIKRKCLYCGKEFEVYPSLVKRSNGAKFCSNKCRTIYYNYKTESWRKLYQYKGETSIEKIIEKQLMGNHIPYIKQIPLLGITIADFLLPNKIVIYADGDYWHTLPGRKEKDMIINQKLAENGYKVYRFWEKDIRKTKGECIQTIWNKKST